MVRDVSRWLIRMSHVNEVWIAGLFFGIGVSGLSQLARIFLSKPFSYGLAVLISGIAYDLIIVRRRRSRFALGLSIGVTIVLALLAFGAARYFFK